MRASYAFALQKNNAEVSTYSVLTPTFIIEPKKIAKTAGNKAFLAVFAVFVGVQFAPSEHS